MISARTSTKILARGFQTAIHPARLKTGPSVAAVLAPQVNDISAHAAAPKPGLCKSYLQSMNAKKTHRNGSCEPYYQYMQEMMMSPPTQVGQQQQMRMFSTVVPESLSAASGQPPREFQYLDASVLDKIKQEMKAVDDNQDGMMQPEEFRKLLRMHNSNFSDSEIDLVTECFYAGTGGRGVAFDRFLDALDTVAKNNPEGTSDEVAKKLGIGSCGAEYILGSKTHAYTPDQLAIELTHKPPTDFAGKLSLQAVKAVRYLFDLATGWRGEIQPNNVMNRVLFLETIAAVPGMVAGILRHFKSLRSMERDGGMLNMFLEEALNERMHLLTFVKMKDPGLLLRGAVLGGQVGFGTFYGLAYIVSPKFCHSFVGYVEEEACATYTKIIKAIEEAPEGSEMAKWRTETAPEIGRSYWHLGEHGTVLELMYAIRADEAEHRDVNHYASAMKKGDLAPVGNPKKQVDMALKKYVKDLMTV